MTYKETKRCPACGMVLVENGRSNVVQCRSCRNTYEEGGL